MKLAEKVIKKVSEYNGKVSGFNLEAGDTSLNDGHWHKTEMDVEGDGQTIKTMGSDEDHVHQIKDGVCLEADGHTHEVLS